MTSSEPVHTESETHTWTIDVGDHPTRTDSPEYVAAKKQMNDIAAGATGLIYGQPPYQDHHGSALWLQDAQGWFLVRNLAGIEWSAQFCADPAKVDLLRQNAKRLYDLLAPSITQQLDPGGLLEVPIQDATGVATWTDSIFNAGVPLQPSFHIGVVPSATGAGSSAEAGDADPNPDLSGTADPGTSQASPAPDPAPDPSGAADSGTTTDSSGTEADGTASSGTEADGAASSGTEADGAANAPAAAAGGTPVSPPSQEPGGVHHYPTPIADIQLFKYDDFQLWVTDAQGNPAAVAPVQPRGSGNASVHVLYATPGSQLAKQKQAAEAANSPLILGPDHSLAKQAYQHQQ